MKAILAAAAGPRSSGSHGIRHCSGAWHRACTCGSFLEVTASQSDRRRATCSYRKQRRLLPIAEGFGQVSANNRERDLAKVAQLGGGQLDVNYRWNVDINQLHPINVFHRIEAQGQGYY